MTTKTNLKLTNDARLGRLTTALLDVADGWREIAAEERAFDGGEFSAPACQRAAHARAETVARAYGFADLDAALTAIETATSYRWVYFSGLSYLAA